MLLGLFHPCIHFGEGSLICHGEHQQNAHCSAILRVGDGPETLLPGRVPDLELDILGTQGEGLDLEVGAMCLGRKERR